MKIKRLVKDIPDLVIKGSKETEITGICSNSHGVAPGNLFIAKKGLLHDGSRYIPDAINAGAAAVLTDMYDPSFKQIVQLIHPRVAEIEAILAAQFYQEPSQKLFMVGITGTNGKTTTASLVKHLLDRSSISCGLIGTIEYIIGPHRHSASHTTPDVCSNHKMLAEMVRENCQAAVMEVTSHALEQGRVAEIAFDVAIYTQLTPEHLDYHHTMEAYANAKQKLFNTLKTKQDKNSLAIINRDCPWHSHMLEGTSARVLTYGLTPEADLYAENLLLLPEGAHFSLRYQGQQVDFFLPLAGRFNVYNALAAIGVCLDKGIPLAVLAQHMATFPPVPGRLEPVPNALGIRIFVDFAHTHDALENTLRCLQELKAGKLITVFGCGGDRDRSKRAKMAQVSERLSDLTVVTSDNPRSEVPEAICAEIASGFSPKARYCIEVDRRAAIAHAIAESCPGDIIVIAGKGHEMQQIFAHRTISFSDRLIAQECCEQLISRQHITPNR